MIICLCGSPGAGKTTYACDHYVLGGLRAGCQVYTNIPYKAESCMKYSPPGSDDLLHRLDFEGNVALGTLDSMSALVMWQLIQLMAQL